MTAPRDPGGEASALQRRAADPQASVWVSASAGTGKTYRLADFADSKVLVVIFTCNHCPYVKAVLDRIVRDTRELRGLGVNAVAIMSNDPTDYPEDSFDNMRTVAAQNDFPFPYLLDESQQVARAYDAVCTPDSFGYNADLGLQYRGRLDAAGPKSEDDTQERELFNAMKQVAETGRGPEHQIPSMGCSIKWSEKV